LEQVNFEKQKSSSGDILEIEGTCFTKKLKVLVVYFDVNRNAVGGKQEIKKEIKEMIKSVESKGLMILGVFNGHLEMLVEKKVK